MTIHNKIFTELETRQHALPESPFLNRLRKILGVTVLKFSAAESINEFAVLLILSAQIAVEQRFTTMSWQELVMQSVMMMNAQEFLFIDPPLVVNHVIVKLQKEYGIQQAA